MRVRLRPPAESTRAWWGAALAVAAVGWGANQFVPLLLMYQHRLSLSTTTVDATFGLYALGLIPGLLVGGPMSDRRGRRPVMALALTASLVGTVSLIFGGLGVGWLFAGRLVSGTASGAAFSCGAAWIKEISAGRSGSEGRGPRRATVAMTLGFGIGPLISGTLAQWAPEPTVVPYLPHLALLLLAFSLMRRSPETGKPNDHGRTQASSPPRGASGRRFLTVVVPLAPWVFGSVAIAIAYLPGLVADHMGGYAVVFTALVTALTAVAGVAIQPLAHRIDHPTKPRLIATSLVIVATGLLVAAAAAVTVAPILVLVAALVLGAGYGCCQVCGLLEVQQLARPDELAGLPARYQAVSYLGFAAPFLLATSDRWIPAGWLLLGVTALAILTLAWVTRPTRAALQSGGA